MGRNGSSTDYCRVESLYQEALDLPAERRPAFVRAACNGDRCLQREVETLLEHYHAAGEEYLAQPVFTPPDATPAATLPDRIGRYDIVQVLGQGGMGTVYEAEQPQPKRRVAVKVLRGDLAGEHLLRRFQREIEVLGKLRHSGIAQIHEAGMGDVWHGGVRTHALPFFAMELIRGRPLTEYANGNHADTRTRLEMFLRVCDAVQHAHQHGVIHRDLKPANILVDATGQPRILDFGVARATEPDRDGITRHTQIGQIVGTLAYMSPEQIAGDGRQLDTRSDVYGLGVVLFELLTGQLPLDCGDCSLADAARIIRDEKPRALSEANRALRGDLETVVAKALAKDPARRYQSAGEMASDIRRHLQGEMIDAKRDSALYVFRKTLFRYRWPLIALHAFMVLLGAFAIYALSQAQRYRELASRERQVSQVAAAAERRADDERQQAEAQADRADAVKAFLQMMLVAADPTQAQPRDVTVREVLDDAARRIQSGALADQPDAEVEIRETIARTYNHLGLYESARPHYEWLHGSSARRFGESHLETVRVLIQLAKNCAQAEDYEVAKTAFERCLELTVAEHGDDQELTLAAMDGLGSVLARMGRAEEAESLHVEALAGVEQAFGQEHELFVATTLNLGDVYRDQGRLEEAERLYLRALELAEQLHGEDAYVTIRIRRQLAFFVYGQTDRLEEAEELLRETLVLARLGLGVEHTETNIVLNWLSRVLRSRGKIDKAERLLREAISEFSEIRAIEIHDSLKVVYELALILAARGELSEAAEVLGEGIERAVKAHGDEHRVLATYVSRHAEILGTGGDYTAALVAARRALDIRLRLFGPEHEDVAYARQAIGWYINCLGRYAEAVETFRQTLDLRQRVCGDTHPETIRTTITLTHSMLRADADAGVAATDILRERYTLARA
jgi:tetratricopeptide (TPR) repeat protein/predicted Ser/Thr protein kinase